MGSQVTGRWGMQLLIARSSSFVGWGTCTAVRAADVGSTDSTDRVDSVGGVSSAISNELV